MNTATSNKKSETFATAKKVLPLMALHGVEPTPNNYAIWFHYEKKSYPALTNEIDALIKKAGEFTDTINLDLHTRYIADERDKSLKATTESTQELLAEVMKAVNEFSGQTMSYSDDLGNQIAKMENSDSGDLHEMAQHIIERTTAMKDSGGSVSKRLKSSQAEIDKLKVELAEAQSESEHDFLTGIYNRKYFDRCLERMIMESKDEKADLCLLVIDIDHFKQFNDQYGHLIGDEVLKIVAKSLTDSVKGKDMVARFGGEEFCILLPNTPIGGAMVVAETIRKVIASKELKRRDTGENYGQITVSIGASSYRHNSDMAPSFIKRADDALYQSKQKGRNCTTMESA